MCYISHYNTHMETINFEVIPYETDDGRIPYDDFLSTLNPKMLAKVLWTVDLLEEFGNSLREPHSKHLRDGIFELRTKQGTDISRVLFFFMIGKQIIITHGFIKKTDATPPEEIELALKYKDDWLRRHKGDA